MSNELMSQGEADYQYLIQPRTKSVHQQIADLEIAKFKTEDWLRVLSGCAGAIIGFAIWSKANGLW